MAGSPLLAFDRALERGYRARSLDAVRTARVFARCEVQALPGSRIRAGEAVAALLAAQQEDGGWPGDTEADSRARVAATLEAVVADGRFYSREVLDAALETARAHYRGWLYEQVSMAIGRRQRAAVLEAMREEP